MNVNSSKKKKIIRDMINCGMVVALGTDFNPNAHCLSMPMVMHLACVNLKMTLNEVRAKVAAEILCLKKMSFSLRDQT